MTQLTTQAQAIPNDLAEKKTSSKNLKFVIGGLLLILLVVALIVQATMSTGAYYMTVGELNGKGAGIVGERVRVSGTVVDGSEDWRPEEITLRFSIADENGSQLPIVFSGPLWQYILYLANRIRPLHHLPGSAHPRTYHRPGIYR